jgi:hypothetical protein
MKMEVSKAIALRNALQNCDGHQVIVKENGVDKSVFCLYELGFDVRFGIAKNLNTLDGVFSTYVKMRDEAIKAHAANGSGIDPAKEPAAFSKFREREVEILNSEIDVDLSLLEKGQLEKSNLPSSVLASLMTIIKE